MTEICDASEPRFTEHTGDPCLLRQVLPLYSTVYAEPPYCEGPEDVRQFIKRWESQVHTPGFRLIIAHLNDSVIGFSFGLPLSPDTTWWNGLLDPIDENVTNEYFGRTFAVIELAVLAQYRRRGVGKSLHKKLLERRTEQRVTLLSRADAAPARSAYFSWGYRDVGRVQPGEDAPIYVAMIRQLPLESGHRH